MEELEKLDRLTDREKECLRQWLQHKTAKEIAVELGISHHAVEKRLKMARTKLGVSTSLEAARMLGEAEGYGQTVAHPPDLESQPARAHRWFTRPLTLGVMAMSIFAAILLAYAAQTGSLADPDAQSDETAGRTADFGYLSASATPEQVEDYVRAQFARFDRDGSGYIEKSEGPERVGPGCCGSSGEVLTGDAAWERFLSNNGDDGDNRISFAEFHDARYEFLLENGISVPREDVELVGERRSPYEEHVPSEEPVRLSAEDFEYVEASPERVRAYVRRMFDNMDANGSGFIEFAEAPEVLVTQQARMGSDGRATYDPDDPARELQGDAAREQYIANVDKDDDGQVSFEEFAEPVMPQFLRRGIPLIPADWQPGNNTR